MPLLLTSLLLLFLLLFLLMRFPVLYFSALTAHLLNADKQLIKVSTSADKGVIETLYKEWGWRGK